MDKKKCFTDKEISNYADVMIWGLQRARKKALEKNSFIEIKYDLDASDLAEKIFEKLILKGFNPDLSLLKSPELEKFFFENADTDQIESLKPGHEVYLSKISGSITLIAPKSLDHLKDADFNKLSAFSKSRKTLRNILSEREKTGDYSWTLCMYPTEALAKAAQTDIETYSKRISDACFLNEIDPVKIWEKTALKIQNTKNNLSALDIDYFHIQSANTDLYVKQGEQRKWLGLSGRNIPSFEIFITPDFRYTTGTFFANQPSFRSGNIIENIKIEFKKGEIISASATKGQDYLLKTIQTDEGAKRVGEFSMTDKNFSRIDSFMANTLYDENFGGNFGNVHIALGSSYSDSYQGNLKDLDSNLKNKLGFNESAIHWDIVNTEEKTVTALLKSGKNIIIYKNGEFKL
ncbi:MAG: aminopeptidase [Desulfobacteraceae bacterium]|nr:aminopeptidase [Desulfobacteraceae bacterium]